MEGIVLLKNDNTTQPLNMSTPGVSLAMIGFWANTADKMLSGNIGSPPFSHDPAWTAEQIGVRVNYAPSPLAQRSYDISAVVAATQKSKYIIYFGGIDNTIEKESLDRTSISWPSGQLAMIKKLEDLGKPLIVVKWALTWVTHPSSPCPASRQFSGLGTPVRMTVRQ